MQHMVERGAEGLLAVQRQVAAVQAHAEGSLQQSTAELRQRLEELHRNHHRHQDLIQVCPVLPLPLLLPCLLLPCPCPALPYCLNPCNPTLAQVLGRLRLCWCQKS